MAQFNGQLGWIATAAEDVAYGTLGAALVYQQGISASLALNENRVVAPCLGSVASSPGNRLATWIGGSITLGHTDEEDDIGVIYDHLASAAGNTYTFGGTPTNDSLSFFCDFDQIEYDFAGCVIQSITWNLAAGDYSTINLDILGQSVAKYTGGARSPVLPPCSEIVIPSDLSTFTINGVNTAGCLKGASITFSWPTTDIGRQRIGSSTLAQPVRTGRYNVTASFNLELDDATNADTIDLVDDFIADTQLGTVVLDNFTIAGCYATGDLPELSGGPVDFNLNVAGTVLTVYTA